MSPKYPCTSKSVSLSFLSNEPERFSVENSYYWGVHEYYFTPLKFGLSAMGYRIYVSSLHL